MADPASWIQIELADDGRFKVVTYDDGVVFFASVETLLTAIQDWAEEHAARR